MVDYAKLQKKVDTKIGAYGKTVTVTVGTRSTYDVALDTYAESLATYSASILILEYNAADVDGSLVKPGDKKVLLPAYELPRIDQLAENQYFKITESGRDLQVKNIRTTGPGDTALMYELQIRGY